MILSCSLTLQNAEYRQSLLYMLETSAFILPHKTVSNVKDFFWDIGGLDAKSMVEFWLKISFEKLPTTCFMADNSYVVNAITQYVEPLIQPCHTICSAAMWLRAYLCPGSLPADRGFILYQPNIILTRGYLDYIILSHPDLTTGTGTGQQMEPDLVLQIGKCSLAGS